VGCDGFVATPLLASTLRGRAQLAARYREERWICVVGDDTSPDRAPVRENHSIDTDLWLSHDDGESRTERTSVVNVD